MVNDDEWRPKSWLGDRSNHRPMLVKTSPSAVAVVDIVEQKNDKNGIAL